MKYTIDLKPKIERGAKEIKGPYYNILLHTGYI